MSSLSTRFTLACPLLTREADPRAVDREMQQARRALGEQDSEKGSAASAGSSGAGGSAVVSASVAVGGMPPTAGPPLSSAESACPTKDDDSLRSSLSSESAEDSKLSLIHI